uniref:Type II toxin-antitoxin system HigB family toxin n=1 Tax=Solibacter usitatus (strain Ellin6076) TaxID=234267 RepID=Q01YH2_SOLUE
MRVISKGAITEFCRIHPDALEPLMHWYMVAKRANWQSLSEVRSDFRHADAVGLFTVFNVAGNKYRLVAVIKYRWKVIYLRYILSHAEYTKERWKS